MSQKIHDEWQTKCFLNTSIDVFMASSWEITNENFFKFLQSLSELRRSHMAFRVLLVDDERDFRDLLSIYLQKEGYETECAGDGQEAFDKIQLNRPNLVIADIRMPVLDGVGLLKKVMALVPPLVPMLFVSGYVQRCEKEITSSPNYMGLIPKPVIRQSLLEVIKKIQSQEALRNHS
jgi:CheY-like chemotaxis protein